MRTQTIKTGTQTRHTNIHAIWLIMMLLTLSTYGLGRLGFDGVTVMLFLMATAVIKATFIIRDFMELRDVSLLWRIIMYGWLWLVSLGIGITYIISI